MILNLFSYPSNYGYIELFKCNLFGQQLSTPRLALVDSFTVDVEEKEINEELLFGGFNQPNYWILENRKINISANFLFANSVTGTLDPAIDLLFNLSAWSYQGTVAPYKFTRNDGTDPDNNTPVNEKLLYENLFDTPVGNLSRYEFFIVDEDGNFEKVNSFPNPMPAPPYWLEVFKYGTSIEAFPLALEPMFRINCAEGSFFPCMVDKISMQITDSYIKLNCNFVAMNYNRTDRYSFINAASINLSQLAIIPLHRSKILIDSYNNDINSTFLITDLYKLKYMDGLITQNFAEIPITEFSMTIDNGMNAIYNNTQRKILRTYTVGYYSRQRRISGNMTVTALRSSQPTFDRYPVLTSSTKKSLKLNFNNQYFKIPYTLWKPGTIKANQNDYVFLDFEWNAITRDRQGQPIFEMEGPTL